MNPTEEKKEISVWRDIHNNLGAHLPTWMWVPLYLGIAGLPLLLIWTLFFT